MDRAFKGRSFVAAMMMASFSLWTEQTYNNHTHHLPPSIPHIPHIPLLITLDYL